jgi:hypothetical protein
MLGVFEFLSRAPRRRLRASARHPATHHQAAVQLFRTKKNIREQIGLRRLSAAFNIAGPMDAAKPSFCASRS